MSTDRLPLVLPLSSPLVPPADLAARLDALAVSLPAPALAQLGDYLGRLLAMNEQMNLTAIRDEASAWERHALDALALVPLLADVPAGARLLDVGSGGGIPGIPLAIARPDLAVTLLDATQKKVSFLAAVSSAIGLQNVTTVAGRAEELRRGGLGTFDVVTARAVARLALLAGLVLPFVRPGGRALLVKGQRADEELAEAARILKKLGAVHEATVPTPTGRIVVLRARG
ncbi:MAG: rRNA small subunit 7-methylguanosine (m7G) methyltransferase GidB [Labilithrix sp.]|nr:rRNA small subunit 7-methylguanosine (m7G) methyltransferase GidB [Labilithrix sp.]